MMRLAWSIQFISIRKFPRSLFIHQTRKFLPLPAVQAPTRGHQGKQRNITKNIDMDKASVAHISDVSSNSDAVLAQVGRERRSDRLPPSVGGIPT